MRVCESGGLVGPLVVSLVDRMCLSELKCYAPVRLLQENSQEQMSNPYVFDFSVCIAHIIRLDEERSDDAFFPS